MRVVRHGVVEGVEGLPCDAELADKRLNQAGSGGDNAVIGGLWGSAREGLEARVDDVGVAHMMGAEEALAGGAPRELGGLEGRPLGEAIAAEDGVVVVEPPGVMMSRPLEKQ